MPAASARMSAPNVNFSIINQTGGAIEQGDVKQTRDQDGNLNVEAVVRRVIADDIGTPGRQSNRILSKGFGVSQRVVTR